MLLIITILLMLIHFIVEMYTRSYAYVACDTLLWHLMYIWCSSSYIVHVCYSISIRLAYLVHCQFIIFLIFEECLFLINVLLFYKNSASWLYSSYNRKETTDFFLLLMSTVTWELKMSAVARFHMFLEACWPSLDP